MCCVPTYPHELPLVCPLELTLIAASSACHVCCSEIQQKLQDRVETLRKQWTDFMPHLAIIQVCTLMTHSVMLECDSGIVSAIRPSVRPSVRHKSVPCKDKC